MLLLFPTLKVPLQFYLHLSTFLVTLLCADSYSIAQLRKICIYDDEYPCAFTRGGYAVVIS